LKENIRRIFELQKAHSLTLRSTNALQRKSKLLKLKSIIENYEPVIFDALKKDLGKSKFESALSEVYLVYAEINFALKNLSGWMRGRKAKSTLSGLLSKNYIYYEPKGVALIIAPWNYPFQLLISPLVSAIAAGNCIMLKPSEISSETSRVITQMINENFDEKEIFCFEGDREVAEQLLDHPFDHIFFTGGTEVGKVVMAAAAKNLTPVTLELGGKSPVIIDEHVNLRKAVEKIVWGKFLNAGQTCIAPDYVLIKSAQQEEFLRLAKQTLEKLYYSKGHIDEKSYGKIINEQHYLRLNDLVQDALRNGAEISIGRRVENKHTIEPTIVTNVSADSALMQGEIFGPVLPLINYDSLEEAIKFVNVRPKPLALYIFSENRCSVDQIIKQTSAGGTTVNDIALHFANPHMPFGGVGASGMGSSHGFFGFKAFAHERAVTFQSRIDFNRFAYPPYGEKQGLLKWLKRVLE
jgi:aldehyde dehydrogenase (NAD+)